MSIDWEALAQKVSEGVTILAPLAEGMVPGLAPAITIASKIIQGGIAAEPTAVALIQQIQAGTPPTQDQLKSYYANYQTDDDALNADIQEHLAALAAASQN